MKADVPKLEAVLKKESMCCKNLPNHCLTDETSNRGPDSLWSQKVHLALLSEMEVPQGSGKILNLATKLSPSSGLTG